ncbi:hypothetical protein D2A34_24780 [Clostridium chromiireducens]|uniref:Uncharacterized protein n=1 Tax=Clostridium chromiireducens TaxID=225345 RepID=A0A399IGV0_9CLOT|nr:hypothetical protein [Clostridium chromiireducens]RII32138.1 hypothetical protein D2A34_24780 [Clostridium chromiireducens]
MIQIYINEIIKKRISENNLNTTILLTDAANFIIGKVIINDSGINFWCYEYSRNDTTEPWEKNKKKLSAGEFQLLCERAHEIKFL